LCDFTNFQCCVTFLWLFAVRFHGLDFRNGIWRSLYHNTFLPDYGPCTHLNVSPSDMFEQLHEPFGIVRTWIDS
jgi:hypothetical protein